MHQSTCDVEDCDEEGYQQKGLLSPRSDNQHISCQQNASARHEFVIVGNDKKSFLEQDQDVERFFLLFI